ncbi:NodT family outer membrane efflux lipoprotein, partial [Pseudomonas savastanoi pv. glycinea str. race 4]
IYTQASQYRVVLQAASGSELGPAALEQIHVKTTDGAQVKLSSLARVEQRQAQLELQENVVRAYIQLSLEYARLDIAEAALAQQQQILDLAQRRLKGGIGTHFEISQAETPLPEAHRQIDALQEAIALSRNQLAALAGKGPGEGAALQRPTLSLHTELKMPSAL